MKNLLFTFLVFIIISCDYPLVDVQEATKPTIAISSFFCPDSVLKVKVEPVVDAFATLPVSMDIKRVKITNLNTNEKYLMSPEIGITNIYTSPSVILKPGDIYKVEAFTTGDNPAIIATDTIPFKKPDFRLVETGVTSCTPFGINNDIRAKPSAVIRFKPNQNTSISYYEFFVIATTYGTKYGFWKTGPEQVNLETTSDMITAEDYYPSNPVIDELGPLSLLFRCNNNHDSLTIDFSYFTSGSYSKDSIYTCNMDLTIELREVSYAYYKYKTSLYNQHYAIDGNYIYGVPAPVTVFSNVENGTGAFVAYSSVTKTFRLESKAYPM
jgi:hypothetical protein